LTEAYEPQKPQLLPERRDLPGTSHFTFRGNSYLILPHNETGSVQGVRALKLWPFQYLFKY